MKIKLCPAIPPAPTSRWTKPGFLATVFLSILYCLLLAANSFAQNNRLWATYYGGTSGESGCSVATDAAGNVYLAGITNSTTGIALNGFQNISGGGIDAFLVKFDASGNRLWATYYGGMGDEGGIWDGSINVATDAFGNVYLGATTDSPSGIASGGFQNTHSGGTYDAFLVKFDTNGNRLWATYYGGTGVEEGRSVAADAAGNVYLTGFTNSATNIASGGFQNTISGSTAAFLVKFDSAGNRLWGTYYQGGNGGDYGRSVATDVSGNVFLAGFEFLVKFNAAGGYLWSTNYAGNSVATDAAGNVYIASTIGNSNIASGGFQNTYGGGIDDSFLVKFNAAGNLLWATYYGGWQCEHEYSIATDAAGNVYMAGMTTSDTSIASNGFQNTYVGDNSGAFSPGGDAFLVKFDASGNRLCATYYGGWGPDMGMGVATDISGNIYLAGMTGSATGIASGGFQNTPAGAFLVKFTSCCTTPLAVVTGTSTICSGQSATLTASGGVSYLWNTATTNNPLTVSPATTTSYSVIVTNACGSDTANTTVVVNPSPTAISSSKNVLCSGGNDGEAAVAATGGSPPYSYLWNPTAAATAAATGLLAGNYVVTTTDANDCINTQTVTIDSPADAGELYLPNAFSPNGDGENDVLQIYYGDYLCIKSLHITIYNRWGERVYETNDTAFKWDGSNTRGIFKGNEGSAVFVYYLKAKLISGEEITRKGNISLIR